MASGYSLLRFWLQVNSFLVLSESITPAGIEVTVRGLDGRTAQLIYEQYIARLVE